MLYDSGMTDIVDEMLRNSHTIAVVGYSAREDRAGHFVARYLQSQGYRIVPVNPTLTEGLGETCYPDLRSIPFPVDLVDIFRRPDAVLEVVEDAIAIGVRYVWMQDGVVNEEAKTLAEAAGIPVVMNNCMLREHSRRLGAGSH